MSTKSYNSAPPASSPLSESRPYTYLAFGAGVQSTALLVAGCLGLHGVKRPDIALFADTMGEPAYGLPKPLKSSCSACPYHGDDYWRFLHEEHPADFEKACALDEAQRAPGFLEAKGLTGTPYLHRSGKPLRSLPFADRSGQASTPWGDNDTATESRGGFHSNTGREKATSGSGTRERSRVRLVMTCNRR